jgi:hypothetical protein
MIPAIDEILRSSEMGGKTQMGDKTRMWEDKKRMGGGVKHGWGDKRIPVRAFNKYEIFEYLLY